MSELWVLFWRYSDGSSAGVLRAYTSQDRAQADIALIGHAGSEKQYSIAAVPLYSSDIER